MQGSDSESLSKRATVLAQQVSLILDRTTIITFTRTIQNPNSAPSHALHCELPSLLVAGMSYPEDPPPALLSLGIYIESNITTYPLPLPHLHHQINI